MNTFAANVQKRQKIHPNPVPAKSASHLPHVMHFAVFKLKCKHTEHSNQNPFNQTQNGSLRNRKEVGSPRIQATDQKSRGAPPSLRRPVRLLHYRSRKFSLIFSISFIFFLALYSWANGNYL